MFWRSTTATTIIKISRIPRVFCRHHLVVLLLFMWWYGWFYFFCDTGFIRDRDVHWCVKILHYRPYYLKLKVSEHIHPPPHGINRGDIDSVSVTNLVSCVHNYSRSAIFRDPCFPPIIRQILHTQTPLLQRLQVLTMSLPDPSVLSVLIKAFCVQPCRMFSLWGLQWWRDVVGDANDAFLRR